jgi:hypothetical protein
MIALPEQLEHIERALVNECLRRNRGDITSLRPVH